VVLFDWVFAGKADSHPGNYTISLEVVTGQGLFTIYAISRKFLSYDSKYSGNLNLPSGLSTRFIANFAHKGIQSQIRVKVEWTINKSNGTLQFGWFGTKNRAMSLDTDLVFGMTPVEMNFFGDIISVGPKNKGMIGNRGYWLQSESPIYFEASVWSKTNEPVNYTLSIEDVPPTPLGINIPIDLWIPTSNILVGFTHVYSVVNVAPYTFTVTYISGACGYISLSNQGEDTAVKILNSTQPTISLRGPSIPASWIWVVGFDTFPEECLLNIFAN